MFQAVIAGLGSDSLAQILAACAKSPLGVALVLSLSFAQGIPPQHNKSLF